MLTYAIRRLLYGVPVIALSSFLIFVFVSTTTDPLETVRLNPRASKSSVDLVVKEHHLDRPVIVRYGYWVRDVLTKSFGTTILTSRPILPDIRRVLGNTVQLVLAAEVLTLFLAICVGVYSALRQYSLFDYGTTTSRSSPWRSRRSGSG
jgi:glutathione transport system permease protein